MNQFHTARDAKEYLIRRILEQADRDGVPPSDLERKMLYFSETGWTLPNMMTVNGEFDEHYDQGEYERKIGQIIQRLRDQPDNNRDEWDEAVQRLRDEDHYLLVLIDGASISSVKRSRGDIARLILAGTVVVAVFLPVASFVYSHVANGYVSKVILEGALLGLVVLVAFLANRRSHKSV